MGTPSIANETDGLLKLFAAARALDRAAHRGRRTAAAGEPSREPAVLTIRPRAGSQREADDEGDAAEGKHEAGTDAHPARGLERLLGSGDDAEGEQEDEQARGGEDEPER